MLFDENNDTSKKLKFKLMQPKYVARNISLSICFCNEDIVGIAIYILSLIHVLEELKPMSLIEMLLKQEKQFCTICGLTGHIVRNGMSDSEYSFV